MTQHADDVLRFEVTVKLYIEVPNAGEAWLQADYETKRHLWKWDPKVQTVTLNDG